MKLLSSSQVLHQVICNNFRKGPHVFWNFPFECWREYQLSSSFKQDIMSSSHCTWVGGESILPYCSSVVLDCCRPCALLPSVPLLVCCKVSVTRVGKLPEHLAFELFSPPLYQNTSWSPNYPINCPLSSLPLFLSSSPVQTASKLVHVFRFLSRLCSAFLSGNICFLNSKKYDAAIPESGASLKSF